MSRAASASVTYARSNAELIAHVIDAVADEYLVTAADICGRRQQSTITWARQVTLALTMEFTGETTTVISTHFAVDPTTVFHAIRKVGRIESETPAAAKRIASIRRTIEQRAPGVRRRVERAVDGHLRSLRAAGAEHPSDAERQLDLLLRDLRRNLTAALRTNPGAVLAALSRVATDINAKEAAQ